MNPTRSRWLRRLAVVVAVTLGTVALLWSFPRSRHTLCEPLTWIERRLDAGPATPPPGPPADVAATPFLLHAGAPGPGFLGNSERSLREAALRARAVEIDVAFSSDLVPFVSHDDDFGSNLGRGPDSLSLHTAAEIEALRFTDGSRPMRLADFARELLPRFERVAIDLKGSSRRSEARAQAFLAALGDPPPGRVQVIGRPGRILHWLARMRPALPLGCEAYGPGVNHLSGFAVYSERLAALTQASDRRAREAGMHRLYWTGFSGAEVQRILAWRPDSVIVDLRTAGADALPPEWRRTPAP